MDHRGSHSSARLESIDVNRWPSFLPHPAVLFVGLIWGMNFVVLQLAYREFPPAVLGLIRFVVMVPLMFLAVKVLRQQAQVSRNETFRLWLAGFLSSGVYMILFLEGSSRVSPAQGSIMMSTVPIWVGVLAIISRQEQFRLGVFLGLVVAYVGVAMVVLFGKSDLKGSTLGIVLVLASAVVWAVSVIVLNPVLKDRPAMGVFALSFPFAGLALVPYGIVPVLRMDYSGVTAVGVFSLMYLILIAGITGFVLYYVAVKDVGPSQAAVIQYIVPVVATIGQFFVLHQSIHPLQGVGMAVVLGGVLLAKLAERRPRPADLAPETG